MDARTELIDRHIREIPDFPKPGILFRDITPLLAAPQAFRATIEALVDRFRDQGIDHIVAIESRGFIFGGPLALALAIPLHVVRKPGKLPAETDAVSYDLEYGSNTLEIHRGALEKGARVVLIDDLLATGGTAAAAAELVTRQGCEVVAAAFVIELAALGGRAKLSPVPCVSLVSYA